MPTVTMVERLDELRLDTSTARRIHELVRAHASTRKLHDVVAMDPVLVSRLLKLANSAQYGAPRAITALDEALNRIGMLGTRDLAWAMALHSLGGKHSPFGPTLQRHGFEVAAGAQLLVQTLRRIAPSHAFVVGLLHDIGAQVFLELEPTKYAKVLAKHLDDDERLVEEEKRLFGLDHGLLAERAMERWQLPRDVGRAVGLHHRVDPAAFPDLPTKLAALVNQSEFMVRTWKTRGKEEGAQQALGQELAERPVNKLLKLSPMRYAAAVEHLPEQIAKLESAIH